MSNGICASSVTLIITLGNSSSSSLSFDSLTLFVSLRENRRFGFIRFAAVGCVPEFVLSVLTPQLSAVSAFPILCVCRIRRVDGKQVSSSAENIIRKGWRALVENKNFSRQGISCNKYKMFIFIFLFLIICFFLVLHFFRHTHKFFKNSTF